MEKINTNNVLIGVAVIIGAIALYMIWYPREKVTKKMPLSRNLIFYNFGNKKCPYSADFTERLLPQLQKIYKNHPNVTFRTIDTNSQDQDEQNLIFYFQVDETPTIVVAGPGFKKKFDGQTERRIDTLTKFINEALEQPPIAN